MKGWVGLVGWPIADGLPTLVVTHQLQVERRTGKVRQSRDRRSTTVPRHQLSGYDCLNKKRFSDILCASVSVRPSICPILRCGVRQVCCCGPGRREILINSGGRPPPILTFYMFGLKTPMHAPQNWGFRGIWLPYWGTILMWPPKLWPVAATKKRTDR